MSFSEDWEAGVRNDTALTPEGAVTIVGSMKNDLLLLLTAGLWGFAFVAQRVGMDLLGPFTYNGVRFALGALSLVPLLLLTRKNFPQPNRARGRSLFLWGGLAGFVLFGGATLQQVGIVSTTAGKAGFITGLYVVLVPLIGAALGTKSGLFRWIGAIAAIIGLYLLSVNEAFTVGKGDFYVFLSAFFFAAHVLLIAKIAPRFDPVALSLFQYAVCSVLNLLLALAFETIQAGPLLAAWLPIVYGGVFSVGIAYSLQIVAQKKAHPTHAAIILSMESLFAAVGGGLLLGEGFNARELAGCALMLAGMIVSQFGPREKTKEAVRT